MEEKDGSAEEIGGQEEDHCREDEAPCDQGHDDAEKEIHRVVVVDVGVEITDVQKGRVEEKGQHIDGIEPVDDQGPGKSPGDGIDLEGIGDEKGHHNAGPVPEQELELELASG